MKVLLISIMALILTPLAHAQGSRIDKLPTKVLAKEARKVVRNGGIKSHRYGDATPYLKRLSYELVERAFLPYGYDRVQWALYIVDRESDFNPGAINTTWSGWEEQAKGLAQLIPKYHTWVNFDRMLRDPYYAARVFVRLSKGGKETSPWCLPCAS